MELIDKEKLLKELLESDSHHVSNSRESVLLDRNRYIVRCQPTVEAIPKADYENRLKADMVAMLTELQLEIEEKFNDRPFSYNHHQRTEFYRDIDELIQQKIDKLKEVKDGKNNY